MTRSSWSHWLENACKQWSFVESRRIYSTTVRWTNSSKWTAITLVHFGPRLTFFLQLTQMLTHCILSSFGKLSLFFLSTLTQTGDSIYFLSGRLYSLGYSLAQRLFGKEFHFAPSPSSLYVRCPRVLDHVWLLLLWFSDRLSGSGPW